MFEGFAKAPALSISDSAERIDRFRASFQVELCIAAGSAATWSTPLPCLSRLCLTTPESNGFGELPIDGQRSPLGGNGFPRLDLPLSRIEIIQRLSKT